MMPLAHYQALGRQLAQARSKGDDNRIAELEAQLRDAPAVLRYLYLGAAPPPVLGETPPPPADQLEQLLEQVRAPATVPVHAPAVVPLSAPATVPARARAVVPSPSRGTAYGFCAPATVSLSASAAVRFSAPVVVPQPSVATNVMTPSPHQSRSASWSAPAIHNVMVVDDDERVLGSWKRAARSHNVFAASDAATARQLVSTEKLDLAIIDFRLGNTSGIDLIRELKRDLPDLMVVLCSGYLSVAASVAAVRAGADIVVFKPITFREILQRIEENAEQSELEDTPTLARAEWEHIMRVLVDCNGNVSMAARRLGIYRSSLQRRLRKYAPGS